MKIMPCPLNGPRNISEFLCHGEVDPGPDPSSCDDRAWTDHLFVERNSAGVVREWWCHLPSGYWFVADRDRTTGDILTAYPPEASPPGPPGENGA